MGILLLLERHNEWLSKRLFQTWCPVPRALKNEKTLPKAADFLVTSKLQFDFSNEQAHSPQTFSKQIIVCVKKNCTSSDIHFFIGLLVSMTGRKRQEGSQL